MGREITYGEARKKVADQLAKTRDPRVRRSLLNASFELRYGMAKDEDVYTVVGDEEES